MIYLIEKILLWGSVVLGTIAGLFAGFGPRPRYLPARRPSRAGKQHRTRRGAVLERTARAYSTGPLGKEDLAELDKWFGEGSKPSDYK